MTDPKVEFEYKFPKDLYLRSYPILGEADQTEVSEAVKMLKTAKKPVIYSGGGVISIRRFTRVSEFIQNDWGPSYKHFDGFRGIPCNG